MPNQYGNTHGKKLTSEYFQQEHSETLKSNEYPIKSMPSNYKTSSVINSNSFKINRISPTSPQYDYSISSSAISDSSYVPRSKAHSQKQLSKGMPRNNHRDPYKNSRKETPYDEDYDGYSESESPMPDQSCLGLSRLGGTILFGTMIVLALASLAGLIAAGVLYGQDSSKDPEWKILGIVVCCIMLVTVVVTFALYVYCYKSGYILNYRDEDNFLTPGYKQSEDNARRMNRNQPSKYGSSIMPYNRPSKLYKYPTKSYDPSSIGYDSSTKHHKQMVNPYDPSSSIERSSKHNKNMSNPYDHSSKYHKQPQKSHGTVEDVTSDSLDDDTIDEYNPRKHNRKGEENLRSNHYERAIQPTSNVHGDSNYHIVQTTTHNKNSLPILSNLNNLNLPPGKYEIAGVEKHIINNNSDSRLVEHNQAQQPQYVIVEKVVEKPVKEIIQQIDDPDESEDEARKVRKKREKAENETRKKKAGIVTVKRVRAHD